MTDPRLERLGLEAAPSTDLDGLRQLYRAWCHAVPFDNVRKLIALFTSAPGPLPGSGCDDFFEAWLAHGTGGTCWPSSNALFALFDDCDFDVRRISGAMLDMGVPNHGSVVARIDGADWLVDSSILSDVPLPLGATSVVDGGPLRIEVERTDGTHLIWLEFPPHAGAIPCRLLDDPVDGAYYDEKHEWSRLEGPFNHRLYARRNHPDELHVLIGHALHIKRADGLEQQLLDEQALVACLHERFGFSEAVIEQLRDCGALAASLDPSAASFELPPLGLPPSQRAEA